MKFENSETRMTLKKAGYPAFFNAPMEEKNSRSSFFVDSKIGKGPLHILMRLVPGHSMLFQVFFAIRYFVGRIDSSKTF